MIHTEMVCNFKQTQRGPTLILMGPIRAANLKFKLDCLESIAFGAENKPLHSTNIRKTIKEGFSKTSYLHLL